MNRLTRDVLDDDPLMTPAEVAEVLRVDVKTVGRWAREGAIPSVMTPGRRRRIRRSVVRVLLEADQ